MTNSKQMLRIVSALLASTSLLIVLLRLYSLMTSGIPVESNTMMAVLGLMFPAAIAAFFAYVAIYGKIPFNTGPN